MLKFVASVIVLVLPLFLAFLLIVYTWTSYPEVLKWIGTVVLVYASGLCGAFLAKAVEE
jgi:hypothetical protein